MKSGTIFLFVCVLVCVRSGVITPPNCDAGGGSALGAVITVDGLSGDQPYTLTTSSVVNVTFAFVPVTNAVAAIFTISAELSINGVEQEVPISATPVGTLLAPVGDGGILMPIWQIILYLLQGILPRTLVTVPLAVPNLSNTTALFVGSITDTVGNVVVCRQGIVNLI